MKKRLKWCCFTFDEFQQNKRMLSSEIKKNDRISLSDNNENVLAVPRMV